MTEKVFNTANGSIHYRTCAVSGERPWLVFLPGLSADHRLFEKQIEEFKADYNLLVWDAPGHGSSRPFKLDFSLADKAEWLHNILAREGIIRPVIIGQSMGGYVAQALMEKYPDCPAGFVSIDSAPLKRKYMKKWEIYALKNTKLMYSVYPWFLLKKHGAEGCAVTEYGRRLMYDMMDTYTKKEYCELVSHGFKILAEAIEADLAYEVSCPALLICGVEDNAGYTKRYNTEWSKQEGIPIQWIPGAGHNSNTDRPELVNGVIREFLRTIL
ncbi:MAG TPA: alpha/beta hydrolase [Clostridiales bacterium]|nr:alpha/beta hydrolase [Clostridiales bacterium]